ncbi:MAG: hypothetical protein ACM3NH_04775 [Candidatus Saccharibacteria bacterium]
MKDQSAVVEQPKVVPPSNPPPSEQKLDPRKFPALLILSDERSEEYLQVAKPSPNGR